MAKKDIVIQITNLETIKETVEKAEKKLSELKGLVEELEKITIEVV